MLDSLDQTARALAGSITELAEGWVTHTPRLPQVWALNQLRLKAPVSAAMALRLAEEHQGDLPYRHLVIEDEGTVAELAAAVAPATGWHSERLALMVLGPAQAGTTPGAKAPPGTRTAVAELTQAEADELSRHWLEEDFPGAGPEVLAELQECGHLEARMWAERRLGVREAGGRALAMLKLRRHGAMAWVEDVYTLPAHRGRGYARRLLDRGIELLTAGRPDMIFIVADDNDWPKDLYRDVGFRPVGPFWQVHRSPGLGPGIGPAT